QEFCDKYASLFDLLLLFYPKFITNKYQLETLFWISVETKNFLQPVALTNPFKPPLEILLKEDEDDSQTS
ncbi:15473_t:CDS:1, partial [Cetraspora pellucida]